MALLDEWKTPEPSPYFDTRLQARLREEMAKPQTGWAHWFRRPVLAAALTVLMGVGAGVFFTRNSARYKHTSKLRVQLRRHRSKRSADFRQQPRHVRGFRFARRSGVAAECRCESVEIRASRLSLRHGEVQGGGNAAGKQKDAMAGQRRFGDGFRHFRPFLRARRSWPRRPAKTLGTAAPTPNDGSAAEATPGTGFDDTRTCLRRSRSANCRMILHFAVFRPERQQQTAASLAALLQPASASSNCAC